VSPCVRFSPGQHTGPPVLGRTRESRGCSLVSAELTSKSKLEPKSDRWSGIRMASGQEAVLRRARRGQVPLIAHNQRCDRLARKVKSCRGT
jgi:hypothetical protein